MARKLVLSIVGAFFSSKSVMVIGTALLISVFFQILHSLYYPFKSKTGNRMQQICLTVLNLFYMSGLLLKTAAVTSEDSDDIGILLVTLLAFAVLAVLGGEAKSKKIQAINRVCFINRLILHQVQAKSKKIQAINRVCY
jgi:hypothetical protein